MASVLRDVLVDFDGTLCPFQWPSRLLKAPYAGVADSLRAIKAKGYRIVIFTARAWPGWIKQEGQDFYDDQLAQVRRFLDKWEIPYDEISHEKRPCVLIIDDSSVNPVHEPGGPDGYWTRLATHLKAGGNVK